MSAENVAAWLLERGRDDSIALLDGRRALDYAQLRGRVAAGAARLHALGFARGSIVPFVGDNSLELVVGYLAALWAGMVPALVPMTTDEGLAAVLRETAAPAIAAPASAHARLAALHARVLPHVLDDAACAPADAVPADRDALALLLYTSGSTAAPKGVMLCARNIEASTQAIIDSLSLRADDRAYLPMPLHYCYGLSVLHTHLRAGGSVFLGEGRDAEAVLDELEASASTGVAAVPTFFQLLLRRTTIATRALPALRYAMVSGGRLDERHVRALWEARPELALFVRYGVTELTAAASFVPPELLEHKLGSIGRGLPGLPLTLVDEDGAPIAPGDDRAGEVVVRGDHVALGYFRDAEATTRSFGDRSFRTGDLARMDADGFVYLLARKTEFIKTGGHRVAPAEIEAVLLGVEGVAEACVYGVPHPNRGEAVVAAVVPMPGYTLELEVLTAVCAEALPPFKVPADFRIVDALPRTARGKLDRSAASKI